MGMPRPDKRSCVVLVCQSHLRGMGEKVLRTQSASLLYAKLKPTGIIYEKNLPYFTPRYIYLLTAFFLRNRTVVVVLLCFKIFQLRETRSGTVPAYQARGQVQTSVLPVIEKERGLIKSIHKRSCNIYFNKICVA
jgi:hypothetical protein